MDELIKSIRVGTVNFFGIIIPGVLVMTMFIVGCLLPILMLGIDLGDLAIDWQSIYDSFSFLIVSILLIFAYVFGYILRLSSPDELDRISAIQVIKKEKAINPQFELDDGWPFDPENELDKYPYFGFRNYLEKRGYKHLTKKLVSWGSDDEVGNTWPDKNSKEKKVKITKRSKATINKMKMDIRRYCPELSVLIESKEGHIRLMAGTWAAFRFAMVPTLIAGIVMLITGVAISVFGPISRLHLSEHYYYFFAALCGVSLWIMWRSNRRITKLFHYRRVSELFHIVQSAYLAQQAAKKEAKKSKSSN
jgi:hypothetical protein